MADKRARIYFREFTGLSALIPVWFVSGLFFFTGTCMGRKPYENIGHGNQFPHEFNLAAPKGN
jgi:hypothetical protein